jgi:hypothetical protein
VHWCGCGRSRYPQGKIWLSVFDHRVFERHLELNATHATISTDDKICVCEPGIHRQYTFRGTVEVSRVHRSQKSVSSGSIGNIKLGVAVAGSALSSDGRKLYATGESHFGTLLGEP